MNHQINYMIAKHRSAQLQRADARARLARDMGAGQRNPPDSKPITPEPAARRLTGRFAPTRR